MRNLGDKQSIVKQTVSIYLRRAKIGILPTHKKLMQDSDKENNLLAQHITYYAYKAMA